MVGRVEDLVAEEVVDVVFLGAVGVGGVGGDGVDSEFAVDVVDYVGWVVDVADARGGDGGGTVVWGTAGCWGGRICRGLTCGGGRSGGGLCCIRQVEAFGVGEDKLPRFAVQLEGWMDRVHRDVSGPAAADAEGGGFGHIDPRAIEGNLGVPIGHLGRPPFASSSANPIGEYGIARPDGTNIQRAVRIGHESPGGIPVIESRVVVTRIIWIGHIDGGVDDGDVVASTGV